MYLPKYTYLNHLTVEIENVSTVLFLCPINFITEIYLFNLFESLDKSNEEQSKGIINNALKRVFSKKTYKKIRKFSLKDIFNIFILVINKISKEHSDFMEDPCVQRILNSHLKKDDFNDELEKKLKIKKEEESSNLFIYNLIYVLTYNFNIPEQIWKILDYKMVIYFLRRMEIEKASEQLEKINIESSVLLANHQYIESKDRTKIIKSLTEQYSQYLISDKKDNKTAMEISQEYRNRMTELGIKDEEIFGLKKYYKKGMGEKDS